MDERRFVGAATIRPMLEYGARVDLMQVSLLLAGRFGQCPWSLYHIDVA